MFISTCFKITQKLPGYSASCLRPFPPLIWYFNHSTRICNPSFSLVTPWPLCVSVRNTVPYFPPDQLWLLQDWDFIIFLSYLSIYFSFFVLLSKISSQLSIATILLNFLFCDYIFIFIFYLLMGWGRSRLPADRYPRVPLVYVQAGVPPAFCWGQSTDDAPAWLPRSEEGIRESHCCLCSSSTPPVFSPSLLSSLQSSLALPIPSLSKALQPRLACFPVIPLL